MLLNNFFKISTFQECKPSQIDVEVQIDTQHEILKAHFPGNPVVPGVCLLQMITDIFSFWQKNKFFLKKSNQIKFINAVKTTQISQLRILIEIENQTEDTQLIKANISSIEGENITFLKFKGHYKLEM